MFPDTPAPNATTSHLVRSSFPTYALVGRQPPRTGGRVAHAASVRGICHRRLRAPAHRVLCSGTKHRPKPCSMQSNRPEFCDHAAKAIGQPQGPVRARLNATQPFESKAIAQRSADASLRRPAIANVYSQKWHPVLCLCTRSECQLFAVYGVDSVQSVVMTTSHHACASAQPLHTAQP